MVNKNKINQISKQFKSLEDKYLMGVIYNSFSKNLRVDIVVPDSLTNGDIVIFDYSNKEKTIGEISMVIENNIKE